MRVRSGVGAGVAAILLHLAVAVGAGAQTDPSVGTLVVAHGGSETWNARVLDVAGQANPGGPVEVSFLMGPTARERPFQEMVRRLEEAGARRIVVVPLLVSRHSGHFDQMRYLVGQRDELGETMREHLHHGGIERPESGPPLLLAPPLEDAEEVIGILADRARALADDPAGQALFVVAHGPTGAEEHAAWMSTLRPVAEQVGEQVGFRDTRLGLLRDDAPEAVRAEAVRRIREIIGLQHEVTGRPVVVVPLLVSKGFISTEKIPRDLEDLPVVYDGEGLLPHALAARWIERTVTEVIAGARASEPAAN